MTELLHEDETWVRELLAPLDRIEPVELPARASRRSRVLRRPLAAAACVVGALVLATGIAVAADMNPFSGIAAFAGIGAVDRAQTSQDVLTPRAAAMVQEINEFHRHAPLPETARLVGQFPGGENIYVLATTTADLCVVIDGVGASCRPPPRADGEPTTFGSTQRFFTEAGEFSPSLPISWGIARDGVTAVSFMGGGSEQTVPVVNNVWVYEGRNSARESITVHFADGTSQTITH